jgi:hypothetical protein
MVKLWRAKRSLARQQGKQVVRNLNTSLRVADILIAHTGSLVRHLGRLANWVVNYDHRIHKDTKKKKSPDPHHFPVTKHTTSTLAVRRNSLHHSKKKKKGSELITAETTWKRTREQPHFPSCVFALPPLIRRRLNPHNAVACTEGDLVVLSSIVTT